GRNDFGSYDKLARGLARQRPKESTLDFAESAYGFADRRDFDGAGVVGRWIERTREKLTELGERAEKAVATVLERVGVRPAERQVERPRGFVPTDRHRDLSELIGGAEPAPMTPEEAARAAARAEVERAFGGAQERETPKPTADDPQTRLMNKLRGDVAAAEKAGDELARIVAEGKLQKAEELAGRGEPLTHRLGEIEKAGQDALKQWAQGQQRP